MANVDTHEEFWGVTLGKGKKEYTWDPAADSEEDIEHKLQLTQACLGYGVKAGERNLVEVVTEGADGNEITCPIISLSLGVKECIHLELGFSEVAKFVLKEGSGPLGLSGVHLQALPLDLDDNEESGESDDEDIPNLVPAEKDVTDKEKNVEKAEKVEEEKPEVMEEATKDENPEKLLNGKADKKPEEVKEEKVVEKEKKGKDMKEVSEENEEESSEVNNVVKGKGKHKLEDGKKDQKELPPAKVKKTEVPEEIEDDDSDEEDEDEDDEDMDSEEGDSEEDETLGELIIKDAVEASEEEDSDEGDDEPEFGDDVDSEDDDDEIMDSDDEDMDSDEDDDEDDDEEEDDEDEEEEDEIEIKKSAQKRKSTPNGHVKSTPNKTVQNGNLKNKKGTPVVSGNKKTPISAINGKTPKSAVNGKTPKKDNPEAKTPKGKKDNAESKTPKGKDNAESKTPKGKDSAESKTPKGKDKSVSKTPKVQKDNTESKTPKVKKDNTDSKTPKGKKDNTESKTPKGQKLSALSPHVKKTPQEIKAFLLKSPNLPKKFEKFSNYMRNNMKVTDGKEQKDYWKFVQENKK